jgi:hypothetical protein
VVSHLIKLLVVKNVKIGDTSSSGQKNQLDSEIDVVLRVK